MAQLKVMESLPPTGQVVAPGDTVLIGANTGPVYRVLAVVADRAWVRDEQRGIEHIVPVSRCYEAFAG